ncbi:MAG TPA: hypothetical protein VJ488_05660 [Dehalococcoidia bacterium]|nr:hypothetical protein [Dehalococcoidia bacterium]
MVTWLAPNKYGKFHIMVTVDNGLGLRDQETITIEVVVNENPVQCPACGR